MTHSLDQVTAGKQDDSEIKVRLGCGSVLTLFTDKDGLHIELQKNVPTVDQLAATRSHYNNGILIFVHGKESK